MSRLYVIADIHGKKHQLDKLLDELVKVENLDLKVDKIVFTGDYIDRGPDSASVIFKLMELQKDHPDNVVCLSGNHEWMAIMYYARGKQSDDADLWFINGGRETIESYRYLGHDNMIYDHVLWLSKLPLFHEEPGFHFSHAPVPRESFRKLHLRGQPFEPDEYIWTYSSDEKGVGRDFGNGVVGVCGHIHQLKKGVMAPRFYSNYIFADAGCGCSSKAPLCAIEVKSRKVIYAWP